MPEIVKFSETEQSVLTTWKREAGHRQALLTAYLEGGECVINAMIRARGLTGNWNISADGTELVKVEP